MLEERPTFSVITLGCRANQYESNAIAGALENKGFVLLPPEDHTDICIINTCTVTAESDRKSKQMIRRAVNRSKYVVVTGCFAEVSKESVETIPGVDLIIGNKNKSAVADAIEDLVVSSHTDIYPPASFESCDLIRDPVPERVRAYIKIEDGCDNNCAYCIIPKARGPVRSKSPDIIKDEVRTLVAHGVKEIILTGIEISKFGSDLPCSVGLVDIIEDISEINGAERISLGSLDPKYLTPDIISRLASVTKMVRHFHLSLQSGCSETLRSMRRKYNAEQFMSIVENINNEMPDAMISVDAIVGFPGETADHFNESLSLLKKVRPLHIHSFPYSPRAGTEAADMTDQIPGNIKKERNRIQCDLSDKINLSVLEEYIEEHKVSPITVLCESIENNICIGHSEHYVEVRFPGEPESIGKMITVTTVGIGYDKADRFVIGEKC